MNTRKKCKATNVIIIFVGRASICWESVYLAGSGSSKSLCPSKLNSVSPAHIASSSAAVFYVVSSLHFSVFSSFSREIIKAPPRTNQHKTPILTVKSQPGLLSVQDDPTSLISVNPLSVVCTIVKTLRKNCAGVKRGETVASPRTKTR